MSNHHIETYHLEEASPNKMTGKDKTPRKRAANSRSKSKTKVSKKDRKPPPEVAARKHDMDSNLGSSFESDHDKGRDKSLEQAQTSIAFIIN